MGSIFNPNVDCFGRDKFSDYRDDMGGVGSFMRQNRTIYLGRIFVSDDIEEIVARHAAEWGPIERLRVVSLLRHFRFLAIYGYIRVNADRLSKLNTRGVAFVTYVNEANAQFAKEAMAHQSLDHNEVLNVRWATADPNPMAQAREARRTEEQAAEAIRRALPAEFVAELEGRDPEARKRRKIESSYGLEGYEAPDDIHFARGVQAVNPIGRRGFELEDEQQRLMLDMGDGQQQNGGYGDGGAMAALPAPPARPEEEDGIFSSSTLAALQSAKVAEVPKATPKASAGGPLVAYGSDDDEDDE